MLQWTIGDATITSIPESETPTSPRFLFDGLDKMGVLARAESAPWLKPHFVSDEGYLLQKIHCLVIDIGEHRSKGLDEVPMDRVATIVTLCAEEECPPLPESIERLHWPLPDPAAETADVGARRRAFAAVRDTLRERIASALGND